MSCGCCPTVHPDTPRPVFNRPGLTRLDYRVGAWADFRGAMLHELAISAGPLAGLRTHEDDDPTVALVDAWAVACDVLSFYTERLAQEGFLASATETVSVTELGRLVGYRPPPGVAAETRVAFTLEAPAAPPPGPPTPGLTPPPLPEELVLPAGLRLQSVPGPGERPQTFETSAPITARYAWNTMPAAATTPVESYDGRLHLWMKGAQTGVQPGDALLLTGPTVADTDLEGDHWDLRMVAAVTIEPDLDSTHVRLEYPFGSRTPYNTPAGGPLAHVMRKRLQVFGHNAPLWSAMGSTFRTDYTDWWKSAIAGTTRTPVAGDWPGFDAARTEDGETVVDLAGSHPEVLAGSWLVLSREDDDFYRELYEVTSVREASRAEFGMSGVVTRVHLRGETAGMGSPRDVTVYAAPEPFVLDEAPLDELRVDGKVDPVVAGDEVVVVGDATALPQGREVIVTDGAGAEVAVVDAASAAPPDARGRRRTRLRLTRALAGTYPRRATVVHANVVRATHGETVHEVLGSGDARRTFQRFALAQGPLTHVRAETADGVESTLAVRVEQLAWTPVPSLFTAGPTDHVYRVTSGHETNPVSGGPTDWVEFGDGRRGARLSTGVQNVTARYRKGIGAVGNLRAQQLSQLLDRPLGVKAAGNPLPAVGGTDPVGVDDARRVIPLTTRTLGRAVSLTDYADFARAYAGVGSALADVVPLAGGRTIVVTVGDPDGAPASAAVRDHLRGSLRGLGDPLAAVEVVAAQPVALHVKATVTVDPAYDATAVVEAARATLLASLAPSVREPGQPVHSSRVVATLAGVPGVASVDLDELYRGMTAALEPSVGAAAARSDSSGAAQGAEVLSLTAGDLSLDLGTEVRP